MTPVSGRLRTVLGRDRPRMVGGRGPLGPARSCQKTVRPVTRFSFCAGAVDVQGVLRLISFVLRDARNLPARKARAVRRSLRRRLFISLSVAVLGFVPVLTFLPSLTNSSAAAGAVVADGRDVGFSFDGDLLGIPVSQRNADFDRIKAMGGTWVRVPFNWS